MAKDLAAKFNSLPKIVRILLALPIFDSIVYGIYRIIKGHILAGVLWLIFGILPGAILDIIDICLHGKVTYFAK